MIGQRERRLARGLRAENLDHAAARNAADAERDVEAQRSRRDRVHFVSGARIAQAHDGAFAKLLFDLAQRGRQSLLAILFHGDSSTTCGAHYFTFDARPLISYAPKSVSFVLIGKFSQRRTRYPVVANYRPLYKPIRWERVTDADETERSERAAEFGQFRQYRRLREFPRNRYMRAQRLVVEGNAAVARVPRRDSPAIASGRCGRSGLDATTARALSQYSHRSNRSETHSDSLRLADLAHRRTAFRKPRR